MDEFVGSSASDIRKHLAIEYGIEFKSVLGKGTFATCYYGCRKNREVALKLINTKKSSRYIKKFLPRERNIIVSLNHPSIVKTEKVIPLDGYVLFIQEYCCGGTLLSRIEKEKFDETNGRVTFRQLVAALSYLQKQNIIHRDLKCENIFLDYCENIKLGDFGFARYLQPGEESNTFCGTRNYAPPEILLAAKYTGHHSDIWSAGVILYIMVTGALPFIDNHTLVEQQRKHQIRFPSHLSDELRDLIYSMLHPVPTERPSCDQICASEWLKNMRYCLKYND